MRPSSRILSVLLPVLPVLCVADEGVGVSFPRTFKDTVRTIVRRLFRVYAHIYSSHFDQICALGIEGAFYSFIIALSIDVYIQAHLNTSYRHFFLFINEVCYPSGVQITHYLPDVQFDLVDKKELAPLDELNEAILAEDKTR
jgi:MOB kinase activator 1